MKIKNPWRDRTRERLRKLSGGDLMQWGNQSIVSSWRAAERYASSGDPADLEEALKECGVYYAILEELQAREDDGTHG